MSSHFDPTRQRIRSKIHESDKHLKAHVLLDAAIFQTLERHGRGSSEDELDRRIIERLRELGNEFAVQQRESDNVQHGIPLDVLYGEVLAKELAPRVEELRMEGFGDTGAPYSTQEEAADWIENSAEPACLDFVKYGLENADDIRKGRKEPPRCPDKCVTEFGNVAVYLPYRRLGAYEACMPTVPGTFLHRLARLTISMAESLGVPQGILINHVLTGSRPERPHTRVTKTEGYYAPVPGGRMISVDYAMVEFHTRDLKPKDVTNIYETVRGHITGKGKKGLKDGDVEIWGLVQSLGGPPQKHGSIGQFWREVMSRWNHEHPDKKPYTTTNGIKRRYQRAEKSVLSPEERECS